MQSTRQRQHAGGNMRSNQYSPGYVSSTTGNYRARNDSAQFTPDNYASFNQQSAQAPWTVASSGYIPEKIVLDADYIAKLERLVHDPVKLEAHGYIMRQLSRKEIEEKGHRCGRCGKKMKERKEKLDHANLPWKKRSGDANLQQENDTGEAISAAHLSAATAKLGLNDSEDPKATLAGAEGQKEQKPKEPICKFHPGSVFHGAWSCCDSRPGGPPCTGYDAHNPVVQDPTALRRNWTFYPTTSPSPGLNLQHRIAIAVDCEMGMSSAGESELIRVTLIDYATGSTLLDSLVYPDMPMAHYNTRFTGIRAKDMRDASRSGKCIRGRDAARKAVWQFVGPDTIVVGHSGHNDLSTLRIIHKRIVDTFLLEPVPEQVHGTENTMDVLAEVDGLNDHTTTPANDDVLAEQLPSEDKPKPKPKHKKGGPRSLQFLAKTKLGREIQTSVHDSVEDAVATRDILHWAVVNGSNAADLI